MDPYPVDLNKRLEVIEEDKSNDDINETEETTEILHMGTSRTVEKKLNKKDKTNKIKNTNCDKPNKLKCNECSHKTNTPRSMRIHNRDKAHEHKLKCNECNIEVKTEATLRYHKEFKHQIFQCDQCDFTAKSSILKKHREKNIKIQN